MPDFATITLQDAQKLIPDAAASWLKANFAYRDGDHWQSGAGWVGPQPDRQDGATWSSIRSVFVSRQVIGELVSRHVAAVVGQPPLWSVQVARPLAEDELPTSEEQGLIDEAEAILESWWGQRRAVISGQDELVPPARAISHALTNALYARRGPIRLFIPARFLDDDGRIPRTEPDQALDVVYLHSLDPREGTVTLDHKTMEQAGIYIYKVDGQDNAEIVYVNDDGDSDDGDSDDGHSVFRVINKPPGDDSDGEEMAALPLGGQITMYEINVPLFVTEQVRSLQAQLNMTLTMMGRNTVQAGFLERVILNGQMPTKPVTDPQTGAVTHVPQPLHIGAGTTNYIAGVEYTDQAGNTHIANPSVIYRDPVSPETFERSEAMLYAAMLAEAQQTHALISRDAAASGESRIQARSDFFNSVLGSATEIETAITWLLDVILRLAGTIAGQPDRYDSLAVSVKAQINTGPLTAEERRVITEMVERGIISHKTALGLLGISNVEAEIQQIATEQEERSRRQDTSLAAALLEARERVNSGQASNGLEIETDAIGQETRLPTDNNSSNEAPENIESTQGLNGAQIRAALEILDGIRTGNIAPEVAIELLIALGIDRQRAERMVAKTAEDVSRRSGNT